MKNDKAPFILLGVFVLILILFYFAIMLPWNVSLGLSSLRFIICVIFNILVILSFFTFLPLLIIGAILSIFEKGVKVGIYFLLVGFFRSGILLIAITIAGLSNSTFYDLFLSFGKALLG